MNRSGCGPDDLGAQGGEHHERDAAADWLADELADGKWHESRQAKASAKGEGHSQGTVKRAKTAPEALTLKAGLHRCNELAAAGLETEAEALYASLEQGEEAA
ncbi:MAG: hypothetical protein ACR2ML_10020 [Solirubrobacteraceae bacterium]